MPEWLVPLGPHDRLAVERRRLQPRAHARRRSPRLRRELRAGQFDVVHLHEPVDAGRRLGRADVHRRAARRHVPLLLREPRRRTRSPRCWAPAASSTGSPCASRSPTRPPGPAGASTAASTGSSPTASRCPRAARPRRACARPATPLEIVFVGQAVERKGLPVLLRAFEALREHVPVRLTIVGASESEVAPLLVERRRRDRARPRRRRREARRARGRRRARRPVARRRVVRHGPDGGLRRGHARRRVRHRRLPRRGARRRRRPARPARRRDGAGRDAARPRARPARATERSAPPPRRAPSATPGRRSPPRSLDAYADARAVPEPEGAVAARRGAARPALRRPRPAPPGAAAARRSSRRPPCARPPRGRLLRRGAVGARGPRRPSAARSSPCSTSGSTGSAARS